MWWLDVLAGLVLAFGVYAFSVLIGARTRWFTSRTSRTAEELYDSYADPSRRQRHAAEEHGSKRPDDGDGSPGR